MNADFDILDLSFADKTFYGFRYNNATGKLIVERINDGSPVKLPDDNVLSRDDYKAWFWTKHTVQFDWDENQKPNLLMEIL
jgi:hypothetical protein